MFTDAEVRSIARWCCRIYAIPLRDLEDVEQEIRIGMWLAKSRFDPAKSRKGLRSYQRQCGIIRARRWKRDRVPMIHLPRHQMDVYKREPLACCLFCDLSETVDDDLLDEICDSRGYCSERSCLYPGHLFG